MKSSMSTDHFQGGYNFDSLIFCPLGIQYWLRLWSVATVEISQASIETGADVMITIFGEFCRQKMAFYSKTNVMIKFLQKLEVA
jgi:hypothetical protein